ncbi:hypothetical protein AU197_17830 [Mycobacterium sp. IS-1590]|uniref:SecDF P1 head subdomain-containing protein n=1 Tax=Mycobacterium sp. IS-1590 TaxID=1772286 RepID=UPI0007460392|nr:hypothetical protein [Mycobacterium sp. IS-1590]KUI41456.1 hypothetical protein AU197_17830 [Mycobacterium sp. IS-1590]
MTAPPPDGGPPPPYGHPAQKYSYPPPKRPSLAGPYLVLSLLAALFMGYAAVAVLTRAEWMGTGPRAGTQVTFSVHALDGSAPSPEALSQTRDMVAARAHEMGLRNAQVTSDGDALTVTAPGDADAVRAVGRTGRMHIRPVIHAIPAEPSTATSATPAAPRPPDPGLARRIANEQQLRQSTDEQMQLMALQFQATRCANDDDLAGHDDPNLPLITCSQDNEEVYLLDKAIITSEQIVDATADLDVKRGEYVVDLQFDGDGSQVWADFTAANTGARAAFVLDTKVVSAPEISEPIPNGRTQITGQFTAGNARALASLLSHDALPVSLKFESSTPETVPGQPGSTPLRIGLLAGGVVLSTALVGAVVYVVRRRTASGAVR